MNYDDTRIQLPLGALMNTAVRCNIRTSRLIQNVNDAISANTHLFQPACQFRDYEVEMSGLCVVQKTSDNVVFCVTKAGSEGMYEVHYVHVLEHTCSNCFINQHRGMICRHQLSVVRFCQNHRGLKGTIGKRFVQYQSTFTRLIGRIRQKLYSLKIPSSITLIPNLNVLLSPMYNQSRRKKG